MGWRTIFISNPSQLSCKHSRLLIRQGDEETDIPIEDIEVIVIETLQATITSHLMSELACWGVAVFFCDTLHTPCGVSLAFHQHHRTLKILRAQTAISVPLRKNLWRLVVTQKLLNQAACLDILKLSGGDDLRSLAKQVRSGDPDNRESVGARLYFSILMPRSARSAATHLNIFLNYGYSILRGAVARALTAYGLLPSLGIHHKNELNAFNLADDFIEPFRPLVDLWVMTNARVESSLTPIHKHALVGLLSSQIKINGGKETVLRAIEITAYSFVGSCENKDADRLALPQLLPIEFKNRE
ncbi:CRISPR-associated endonuclease Cas1 [Synergistales bacterium]|nr:CRISPR-associated endonuclease Cas1 [Synergistales bacterium]